MTSARCKLPIGIQTFRKIREGDAYYYVDKTPWAAALVDEGSHYFLARPRRFGKSLFLDTLKELWEGNEQLFKGLYIHERWEWSVRWPVVRLSFGSDEFTRPGQLHASLMAQLDSVARRAGLVPEYDSGPIRFARLLEQMNELTGSGVVVLVDEYDKPILDALEKPDVAAANRDYLRGLYSVIKDREAHIRFSFLTGVSKFSRVSLFSGLNHLRDITLDPRHSAICGYRETDLDTVFAPELEGLDRAEVREWYSGYGWLGKEKVYNPFDVLLLFDSRKFKAHWFETGSPAFLIRTLMERGVTSLALEAMVGTEDLLSRFDVEDLAAEALLFQTGYLTIVDHENLGGSTFYRLGYPNREVKQSLNQQLLRAMGPDPSKQGASAMQLYKVLAGNDFAGLEALGRQLFASIPYEWHVNNEIARYEGYYASVFYSWFAALGLDTTVEESSSQGRLDMALRFGKRVYLFEFKVVESAGRGAGMAQLRARDYAAKYRSSGKEVFLVAVEFSREARNIASFEVERL